MNIFAHRFVTPYCTAFKGAINIYSHFSIYKRTQTHQSVTEVSEGTTFMAINPRSLQLQLGVHLLLLCHVFKRSIKALNRRLNAAIRSFHWFFCWRTVEVLLCCGAAGKVTTENYWFHFLFQAFIALSSLLFCIKKDFGPGSTTSFCLNKRFGNVCVCSCATFPNEAPHRNKCLLSELTGSGTNIHVELVWSLGGFPSRWVWLCLCDVDQCC